MRNPSILALVFFVFISFIFFHPVFNGKIPFPGDLLVGEYTPYSSYDFLGYAPGGYPNKGQAFDVLRLIYPAKFFTIEGFKNGEIPLWNPYIFSGNPHMASLQSGSFYPLNIMFLFLPFNFAWTIYIILQPILAGYFTYLLLKEYKLSSLSSIFGGFTFSFSSFMTVWMLYGNLGHTFIWLPLILLLIHKIIKKPSIFLSMILGIVLSLSILAGYIQMSIYVYIFSFLYAVFIFYNRLKMKKYKEFLYIIIAYSLSLLISAVQILPTVELFLNSTRTSIDKETFLNLLIPINHLITIIFPDFFGNPASRNYWLNGTYIERVTYIGVVPLMFAVFSLTQKPTKLIYFYLISSLVILLLVFDTSLSRFLYSIYIPPIISTGVPTRIVFILSFSLAVLSGFGLDFYLKNESKKRPLIVIAVILSLVFLAWCFVYLIPASGKLLENLLVVRRNLIVPTATIVLTVFIIFIGIKFRTHRKLLPFIFIILVILELFYFFNKITPFSGIETIYPETRVIQKLKQIQGIDRVWGYSSAAIETNIHTYEEIYSIDGYDALHLRNYGELLTAGKTGNLQEIPRSFSILEPGFSPQEFKENIYRQNLLNLLGVKYILHKSSLDSHDSEVFSTEFYKLIWSDGTYQIYENLRVLPRAFLTGSYIVDDNKENRIEFLTRKSDKTIILDENLGIQSTQQDLEGSVKILKYSPNKIVMNTNTKAKQLLFLSDVYDKGWEARIDGEYARIYKANHAFRAVIIPEGNHNIEFNYIPKSFIFGAIVSTGAIFITLFSFIFLFLKANDKKL